MPRKLAKDRERIINEGSTLPVINTCKVVNYKRKGITD